MSNPLLLPQFPIPFDKISPEQVPEAVDQLLQDAERRIEALLTETEPRSFDTVMLPFEAITERLDYAMTVVGHLESTVSNDAWRKAYNEAQPRVSEFVSKLPHHQGLWAAIKLYAESDDAKALSAPRARFLEKTMTYFRRHGADLEPEAKQRLSEIDVALSRLTLRFSQNVLDATNAYELLIDDEALLAGLPESARKAAQENAKAKGKSGWRFTLQAPSYSAVLTHLDSSQLREQMYFAFITRATKGAHDNGEIVDKILALRKEKSSLLTYDDFTDFVTEERMAGSGQRAREFIEDLHARTEGFFQIENKELLLFRRELEGADAPDLKPWDISYYAEKMRQARYQFDDEALRPYFGFESVLKGLFEIAKRLYAVRFEPWTDAPCWHESVRSYKLIDEEDNSWRGAIYIDAFPRETKQGGAWMYGLQSRHHGAPDQPNVAVLAANVTPPLGGGEAELTHRELETMFHEFGHLLHHCLSDTELRSQAGTSVAWDFVELPSQIFENWCWEREALDLFACHRQSGERIPSELFDALQRSRCFRTANAQMRQLGYASADLLLHSVYDPDEHGSVASYAHHVLQKFTPAELPEQHMMMASFGHLFGSPVGYAAGYYSYKWAEVLDADAFTRFKREGLFSRAVARDLRTHILSRGDEADPQDLYRDFMGRDPELSPLLTRLGLIDNRTPSPSSPQSPS